MCMFVPPIRKISDKMLVFNNVLNLWTNKLLIS